MWGLWGRSFPSSTIILGSIVPIGLRIKEERERLGLSQTAIGEVAGIDRKSQFNYETGKRSPDANYLAALAAAGVDVFYVLTGERRSQDAPYRSSVDSQPLTLTAREKTLVANYRGLRPSDQDAAQTLLDSLAQSKVKKAG